MNMKNRVIAAAVPIMLMYGLTAAKLYSVICDERVISAGTGRGYYTIGAQRGRGTICDRSMTPIVNTSKKYLAVIDPVHFDSARQLRHIIDTEKFRSGIAGNTPFLCEADETAAESSLPVIWVWDRYPSPCPAQHIVGYTSGGSGVSGIEAAYDDILSGSICENITYKVNALGQVLAGEEKEITETGSGESCVITSLDLRIQEICEEAMNGIDMGAAVVMDVHSGEVIASVSRPVYDTEKLADYLDDEDAPFINRAFSAYSVGSVFKTVIAASALEAGISEEYTHRCAGYIKVGDQRFGCHLWGGHGELDMRGAMIESCNPYFISLGRNIPDDMLYGMITAAGFGSSCALGGIKNSPGTVPAPDELAVPAEKANLCFGQGRLTASPLQVCRFICAAANGGILPEPVLILGTSEERFACVPGKRIISESTSAKLKSFMKDTLGKHGSLGIPIHTDGGGKTSTAQTGRYDENGNEYMNCWFAGFFPYDEPKYAVVIMAEEGISGNVTCAPVFREIADKITLLESGSTDRVSPASG